MRMETWYKYFHALSFVYDPTLIPARGIQTSIVWSQEHLIPTCVEIWWMKQEDGGVRGSLVLMPYHHLLWSPTPPSRHHSEPLTSQTRCYYCSSSLIWLWSFTSPGAHHSRSLVSLVAVFPLTCWALYRHGWIREPDRSSLYHHHVMENSFDVVYFTGVIV